MVDRSIDIAKYILWSRIAVCQTRGAGNGDGSIGCVDGGYSDGGWWWQADTAQGDAVGGACKEIIAVPSTINQSRVEGTVNLLFPVSSVLPS